MQANDTNSLLPIPQVVWGKHDPAFIEQGALAFRRDLPAAEVHILDGGHFVMDTRLDEVTALTRAFLRKLAPASAGASVAR